jgi:hypothetical protein
MGREVAARLEWRCEYLMAGCVAVAGVRTPPCPTLRLLPCRLQFPHRFGITVPELA